MLWYEYPINGPQDTSSKGPNWWPMPKGKRENILKFSIIGVDTLWQGVHTFPWREAIGLKCQLNTSWVKGSGPFFLPVNTSGNGVGTVFLRKVLVEWAYTFGWGVSIFSRGGPNFTCQNLTSKLNLT